MRFKLDEKSKTKVLIGTLIAISAIAFYFFISNFSQIQSFFKDMFKMLFPFVVGFVIAFLLNPIMMFFENKILKNLKLKQKTKRNIAALIAVVIGIVSVGSLLFLIVLQVRPSIENLVTNYDAYVRTFERFLEDGLLYFNLDINEISNLTKSSEDVVLFVTETVSQFAPKILDMGYGLVMSLLNILIGIMAGLYLLMDKEKFLHQCRKLNWAFFPKNIADYIARFMKVLRNIFYDFIVGKAIDSFIIGIICYVGMILLGFEYAALISVIVGITNMIPVFGPFIGAIPGIFLLLLVDPMQSLYFALFVFGLQQFDGNFLGPLILGDKLGIPTFWILFSVTVGGALFGIIGMFIGVPVFAAIYFLLKEFVDFRIKSKNLIEQTKPNSE